MNPEEFKNQVFCFIRWYDTFYMTNMNSLDSSLTQADRVSAVIFCLQKWGQNLPITVWESQSSN